MRCFFYVRGLELYYRKKEIVLAHYVTRYRPFFVENSVEVGHGEYYTRKFILL